MFTTAQKFRGKYDNFNGQGDLTLSVSRVFISGKQPFEILIKRNDRKGSGPTVIQRIVVDIIEPGTCQGQNVGRHGEPGNDIQQFQQLRIKDMCMKIDRNQAKIDVKEFRYPSSVDEIESRVLMFTSTYIFDSDEDGRMHLELTVKRDDGFVMTHEKFLRVDSIERKYSVTTDRSSRLDNQRMVTIQPKDVDVSKTRVSVPRDPGPKHKPLEKEFEISDSQDHIFLEIPSQQMNE